MPVQRSTTTPGPGGERERALQEHLGLGAGHEHPGPHGHLDRPEHRGAEQVLQGFTGGAARDQRLERPELRLVGRVGEQEAPARDTQDVSDEQLGVDARGGDAGRGEPGGDLGDERARTARAHASSAARAMRSERSAERRASSTASRSPSSTRSRSWDL